MLKNHQQLINGLYLLSIHFAAKAEGHKEEKEISEAKLWKERSALLFEAAEALGSVSRKKLRFVTYHAT